MYIDAPDSKIIFIANIVKVTLMDDNNKKRSADNDKRRNAPVVQSHDEDEKLQLVDEKGEEADDAKLPVKDIQKRA